MNTNKPRYDHIPDNFGALSEEYSRYDSSKYVILPVAYDSTTSYLAGTRHGPRAILEASQNMELFDEEFHQDFSHFGICTLPQIQPVKGDPQTMIERLEQLAKQVLADGKFLLTLGGEHSITLGPVRAYSQKFNNLVVLQCDAHLDLRDNYEGSAYSHACVMRRTLEICPRIAVGIRSFSEDEFRFVLAQNDTPFYMSTLRKDPNWVDQVCERLTGPVYLSIDMDVFDPATCPGVGTPEPGGMNWLEMLELLKKVARIAPIVGADIVELRPISGNVVSEFTAAKLAYKIIGLSQMQSGNLDRNPL